MCWWRGGGSSPWFPVFSLANDVAHLDCVQPLLFVSIDLGAEIDPGSVREVLFVFANTFHAKTEIFMQFILNIVPFSLFQSVFYLIMDPLTLIQPLYMNESQVFVAKEASTHFCYLLVSCAKIVLPVDTMKGLQKWNPGEVCESNLILSYGHWKHSWTQDIFLEGVFIMTLNIGNDGAV